MLHRSELLGVPVAALAQGGLADPGSGNARTGLDVRRGERVTGARSTSSKGEHVGIARVGVPFGKELPSSENSCIAHALAYGHVLTTLSVEGPHVMD